MKNTFLSLALFLLLNVAVYAQNATKITENQPFVMNGVEFGYRIKNEESKEIKDDKFSRYEIEVYVINKSGCSKILLDRDLRENPLGFGSNKQVLALFECANATGKRLTSKSQYVDALPYTIPYRVEEKTPDGKSTNVRYVEGMIGYGLRNGQTVAASLIVITPFGEKPDFQVKTILRFSDL